MLATSCRWCTIGNKQCRMLQVVRKAFYIVRSGTQYVAMVIQIVRSYCRALLVEPYCKKSNISDKNWLRYPCLSYLIKIWLSVWRHHLANLHIKTWISVERKEIFENSILSLCRLHVYVLKSLRFEICNFHHSTCSTLKSDFVSEIFFPLSLYFRWSSVVTLCKKGTWGLEGLCDLWARELCMCACLNNYWMRFLWYPE